MSSNIPFVFLVLTLTTINVTNSDPDEIINPQKLPERLQINKTNLAPDINAIPGQYSFLVLFFRKKLVQAPNAAIVKRVICSGNILCDRWVLTTANPLGSLPPDSYFFTTAHIIEATDPIKERFFIDLLLVHPDYDPDSPEKYNYNVALARTEKPIKFHLDISAAWMTNFDFTENWASDGAKRTCQMLIWVTAEARYHQFIIDKFQMRNLTRAAKKIEFNKGDKCNNVKMEGTLCFRGHDTKQPTEFCSLNIGAPIVCNCIVVGVYSGRNGSLGCWGDETGIFTMVFLNRSNAWINNVLTSPNEIAMYPPRSLGDQLLTLNFNLFSIILIFIRYF